MYPGRLFAVTVPDVEWPFSRAMSLSEFCRVASWTSTSASIPTLRISEESQVSPIMITLRPGFGGPTTSAGSIYRTSKTSNFISKHHILRRVENLYKADLHCKVLRAITLDKDLFVHSLRNYTFISNLTFLSLTYMHTIPSFHQEE